MGGYNFDNEKTQVGVGLNYMLFQKISLGAMAMITPFEDGSGDDYMIMYNAKYKLGKFTLVGGLMDMKMGNSPIMNMDMEMNMEMNMDGTDPYFGIEYKPFKKYPDFLINRRGIIFLRQDSLINHSLHQQ